jgi:hypothetical protein
VGKQERGVNRFDEIVEGALLLFVERGYDNTPLSAVADRLGLTKAVFIITSRRRKICCSLPIGGRWRGGFCRCSTSWKQSGTRKNVSGSSFSSTHARWRGNPVTGLLIREARRLAPAHLAEIKKSWRRGLSILRDSIVELRSAGRCRSDINATHAAFAAIGMTNWIPFWFNPKRPEAADSMARMMEQPFMDGLLHRGARSPARLRIIRTSNQNTVVRKRISRS